MNPFVNPNKRDVNLPAGCKDLMDVLKQGGLQPAEIPWEDLERVLKEFVSGYAETLRESSTEVPSQWAIGRFIHLLLVQAHQDRWMELVFGVASPDGGAPIRYKIGETWYDISPSPSGIRPQVISEIERLASLAGSPFPKKGVLEIAFGNNVRSRWNVAMASPDGECILTRAQD